MKTKYIYIAFLTILCGGSLVACSNGDEFFKDERYKKMIYAISDNEQIFHAEFELNNEEDIIGVQPFAVSGTNPIDQDVHLTIEKDPELLTEYNYNTYMDETDKYARELKDGDYSLLSSIVEIKAGVNPSYEVGKLQVKIRHRSLKNYPLTLLTFFRSALKRQHLTKSMKKKGMYYSEFIKRISMHPKRHPLTMPLPALWMMS